jgi:endonuclease III
MLVACCLVNLTTWEQARPVLRSLMRHHTIGSLASADPASIEPLLRPLGLQRVRSERLTRMARAWLHARPRGYNDVIGLPGCGKYAGHSWAIFIDGCLNVQPDDGKLNWYLDKIRSEHDRAA